MTRLLLLFLLLVSQGVSAQQLPSFITDSLDRYITGAMKQWELPGIAVGIIKDGKIVYAKGFGVREAGKNDAVDTASLFMIASCSKAFTGTALALLEQEKKLSLDQKVTTLLPDFRLYDSLATREVTVRDLLCHRIGLETFQGDLVHWDSNLSRAEIVAQLAKYPPQYGFRSHYGYSNAAFTAAGQCIAYATDGMSWESYVRARFFEPLGMRRTSTTHQAIVSDKNAARPHTRAGGKEIVVPYDHIDNLGPAASVNSSVNDLLKWVHMHLDSGRFNGTQVVPYSVLDETYSPQIFIDNLNPKFFPTRHFSAYGLGWYLSDYGGRKVISHDGGAGGFLSNVTLVPEEKLGFVILTNSDNNSLYKALYYQLLDAFLKQPYRNYNSIYLKRAANARTKEDAETELYRKTIAAKNKTPLPLTAFEGVYRESTYGRITIKAVNNNLELTMEHHPDLKGKLEYLDGNSFHCTFSNPVFGTAVIPFDIEEKQVTGFKLTVNSNLDLMPYFFRKLDANQHEIRPKKSSDED
jgi:CubicO group peptidase (beta-lactamase class C family)